ncbi:MAG TPA: hypothetical protein VG722_08440, partial [Tepidisphaeraceae bacterium]|nr:hypothetical protein [Tepidisphaeraceae bacterium]
MKLRSPTKLGTALYRTLSDARLASRAANNGDAPLRAELFNLDQLERHARRLAETHPNVVRGGRERLLTRLRENEQVLADTYRLVTNAAERNLPVAPGAEWLLDNFYIIEEQIQTARRHLPRSYSRQLPRLSDGPLKGYPRVYHIAMELISHVDGWIDMASLRGFVASYQTARTLKLGELWAIPIMLRLALIENLRRVALRIADGRRDRDSAEQWAQRM